MKRKVTLLLLVLSVGLFLRVYDLGTESLWADEGLSVATVSGNFVEMKNRLTRSIHPPLYYLVLHGWTRLFGTSEVAVRFPSVLFGLISILLAYNIGKELFSQNVGLLTSLMVAISPFHIRYAQEARNYSLLFMLSLISLFYFIKMLKKDSWQTTILYSISSLLLIYTHVYGLFTILTYNVYVILRKTILSKDHTPSLTHWLFAQCLLVLPFLPWINVIIHHVLHRQRSGSWQVAPSLFTLGASFFVYAGSLPLLILCTVSLGAVFVYCQQLRLRESGDRLWTSLRAWRNTLSEPRLEPLYLLFFWFFCHNILPLLLSNVLTPFYRFRYTIAASLTLYLIVSKAILRLPKQKTWAVAFISLYCLFSLFSLRFYYQEVNKERWREVAHYIDDHAAPEDLVIVNAANLLTDNLNYYSKRHDLTQIGFPSVTQFWQRIPPGDLKKPFESTVQAYKRVWVVFSHTNYYADLIQTTLNSTHTLTDHRKYHSISYNAGKKYLGIELLRFDKMPKLALPYSEQQNVGNQPAAPPVIPANSQREKS